VCVSVARGNQWIKSQEHVQWWRRRRRRRRRAGEECLNPEQRWKFFLFK
jgi:hypothetical protein